jgi:hypothetical protein
MATDTDRKPILLTVDDDPGNAPSSVPVCGLLSPRITFSRNDEALIAGKLHPRSGSEGADR